MSIKSLLLDFLFVLGLSIAGVALLSSPVRADDGTTSSGLLCGQCTGCSGWNGPCVDQSCSNTNGGRCISSCECEDGLYSGSCSCDRHIF